MRSVQELKDRIGELPKGNLCFKLTGGKRRCYHQWTAFSRFAQAQALVHALLSDGKFSARSRAEQDLVAQTILQDVAGRMLEDVVMYETHRNVNEYLCEKVVS